MRYKGQGNIKNIKKTVKLPTTKPKGVFVSLVLKQGEIPGGIFEHVNSNINGNYIA